MAEASIPGASSSDSESDVFDVIQGFSKIVLSCKKSGSKKDPENFLLKDKEYFDLLYKYEMTPEMDKKLEECICIILEEIVANFSPTNVNIGKVYCFMYLLKRIPVSKDMLLNTPQLLEVLENLQHADSDHVNNSEDVAEKLIFKTLELRVRTAARELLVKYAEVLGTNIHEMKKEYLKMQKAAKKSTKSRNNKK